MVWELGCDSIWRWREPNSEEAKAIANGIPINMTLARAVLEHYDMPGKGHRFTAKQDRQAKHVEDSERARGMSPKKAKSAGYATVNANKKKSKRGSRY